MTEMMATVRAYQGTQKIIDAHHELERRMVELKGRGLMSGLAFKSGVEARAVQSACFERRLVIECSGPDDEVLKPLPALTISDDELAEGLNTISASIDQTLGASA